MSDSPVPVPAAQASGSDAVLPAGALLADSADSADRADPGGLFPSAESQPDGRAHWVLARKWRPRTFDALVGQDLVVRALRHALDGGRLHHAYLLSGTRGVGKTTIARLLAKAVNCESGPTSHPCGHCVACVGVDSGRFPDYVEMDAASNRRVEEMTVLLENAAYLPSIGRYKVFVIDEVHMLTNHAFNAMLKTLEEPPAHVLFVLATTDPQKVPVTVLSRCLHFGLRNVPPDLVAAHLAHVLGHERIEFDDDGLRLLGRAAAGSVRDALSLLDQAIALGGGRVDGSVVREMLGTIDDGLVDGLLEHLGRGDGAGLVALADQAGEANVPAGPLLLALATRLQRIAVMQCVPAAAAADTVSAHDRALAARLAPADLQVWYQVATHAARDLPLAPDPAVGLTMALVRMLAFGGSGAPAAPALAADAPAGAGRPTPAASASVAPSRPAGTRPAQPGPEPAAALPAGARRAEPPAAQLADPSRAEVQSAAQPGTGSPRAEARSAEAPRASTRPAEPSGAAPRPAGTPPPDAPQRETQPSGTQPSGTQQPATQQPGTQPSETPPPGAQLLVVGMDWVAIAQAARVRGLARQFLNQSELIAVEGSVLRLRVPSQSVADPAWVQRARDAVVEVTGRTWSFEVVVGKPVGETLAVRQKRDRSERLDAAERAIRSDPFVSDVLQSFDATIVPDSIQPIEGDPPR